MTISLNELLVKSARRLEEVHSTLEAKAKQLIGQAYKEGICIIITQGLRTIAEQDALYAQGRTKAGKVVTNARGGSSFHNFGLAFDFCVVDTNGQLNWNVDKRWHRVGAIGESLGLEWGGRFKTIVDIPHFQLTFGLSLSDLRSGKRPGGEVKSSVSSVMHPTIRLGDKSDAVKELQKLLNKLGYKLTCDSDFGQATESAVKDFQLKNGLVVDGIVGRQTWSQLV